MTADTAEDLRKSYGIDAAGLMKEGPGAGEAGADAGEAETDAGEPETAAGEDTAIKGKTTFRELISWGLTQEEIEEIIGVPMGPPTQTVRDYFMEQGLEFSTAKEKLQQRIDER